MRERLIGYLLATDLVVECPGCGFDSLVVEGIVVEHNDVPVSSGNVARCGRCGYERADA